MKHIAGWLRRNKTLMAQAKDLARQLQEAWDDRDKYKADAIDNRREYYELWDLHDNLKDQLHRVARERDEERRQRRLADMRRADELLITIDEERDSRLAAEAALADCLEEE